MNDKGYFYTVLGGVVFLIVVFLVGKNYGRNKPPGQITVPQDDPGSTVTSFDPKGLTDRLYEDISGWSNPFSRDMEAWNTLVSLSDTDFVKVLNDWNLRYYSRWKQTLYQAYMNEKFNPFTSANLLSALTNKFSRLDKSKA